jgi:uncharacterized protein (UPF0276 family)
MQYSIGTTYEGKNLRYLKQILKAVNHIEVSPDSIALKTAKGVRIHPQALEQFRWISRETDVNILIHGVGMSIGSYDGWNDEYINLLDQLLHESANIRWHSEHLAYTRVNGKNLGTMLTLPRTKETLELICKRVDAIQKRYRVPFLLENVISMFPDAASTYSDAAFLNSITESTGCGLILDIYNLQCDSVNFDFKIDPFLEELNLNTVYEMHLAGGNVDPEFNFQMDVHSRLTEESTLQLAKQIVKTNPKNLQAITFELLEEFIPNLGTDKIIEELKRLNLLFNHDESTAVTNKPLFVN